jgi:hypothetical protein
MPEDQDCRARGNQSQIHNKWKVMSLDFSSMASGNAHSAKKNYSTSSNFLKKCRAVHEKYSGSL